MEDNNIHDTMEVMVSVIAYAAAVSVIIMAVTLYIKNLNYLSERVDEKQSVETTIEQTIDYRPEMAEKDVLTKAQVLDSIIAIEEPDRTTVKLDGITLDAGDIKLAKDGDERGVNNIRSAVTHDRYERRNIYDTDAGNDYLASIEFKGL